MVAMTSKTHRFALAAALVALPAALAAQEQEATQVPEPDQGVANFIDAEGNEVGAANLTDGPGGGVLIGIQIEGLPAEQWVAFHVHENGECDPEGGFESAGGHYNPDDSQHGYLVEGGPHAGDMPNQYVPADGPVRSQVFNPNVTLGGDAGIRGRALMIHAQPDDYESQPSGAAGDRLACAVIE
jgi:superoxide dismutase, Cu-Zn family